MPRLLRLCLISLLAASLGACASLSNRDPLRVDLVGLEPLPGQGLEALDLDVNGQPLASGVSDQSGSVPRFGETVLSVPVSISAFSVVRQAWGAAGYQPGQEVPYVLRGKLADGLFGTRRFSDSGTLNWPQPPSPY